jgi:hypothetical protein
MMGKKRFTGQSRALSLHMRQTAQEARSSSNDMPHVQAILSGEDSS